ncbi:SDR family oxidoreductase [Pseudonocardia kujensis]|uniref:SDR family oxidoreductase n=1 Tax=Pseudonocardia kujensis TaxID=1128675 RepID=UPI001E40A338|nr:SDR family oxidoreductase [Pseudonocardia kujensis]MCE0764426.1 SDR family oxidoreductase [Pseudonocardia kujensis]
MRIVVVGGTGLIGKALVQALRERGHEAVPASPSTGVDTLTGAGVADALAGAQVVVDVTNSPSFEDGPVLDFFTRSTTTLLGAEREAGVGHHVALSIVGTDRLPEAGYLRAKVAQEKLIIDAGIPFTILRATQFFEFLGAIADSATDGGTVTLPEGAFQPVAAADVVATLAEVATGAPLGGTLDLAGPDRRTMEAFVREALAAREDPRTVTTGPEARYFGTAIGDALVPAGEARLGEVRFEDWLKG